MATGDYLKIDGNHLEGGGQILRIAIGLSSLLNKPIEIFNIRAGRPKPGLAAQHLHGIQLACRITNGTLIDAEIGSTSVKYRPRKINAGSFEIDVQTAGSVTLILQSVIPILIFASGESTLDLRGGTHVPFAPFVDFFTKVLPSYLPFMKHIDIRCHRQGFYPRGGGHITVKIDQNNIRLPLEPIVRNDRGQVTRITGTVIVSGRVKRHVAEENRRNAMNTLVKSSIVDQNQIELKINESKSTNDALAVQIEAHTTTGCTICENFLVKNRNEMNSVEIGAKVAANLLEKLNRKCCTDDHVQDQLIIYMALAQGRSSMLIDELTMHTRTAIWVTELMTNVRFSIEKLPNQSLYRLQCDGIGYTIDKYYNQ